jgi:hypothetical protein
MVLCPKVIGDGTALVAAVFREVLLLALAGGEMVFVANGACGEWGRFDTAHLDPHAALLADDR